MATAKKITKKKIKLKYQKGETSCSPESVSLEASHLFHFSVNPFQDNPEGALFGII